jgi:hypothetical protein
MLPLRWSGVFISTTGQAVSAAGVALLRAITDLTRRLCQPAGKGIVTGLTDRFRCPWRGDKPRSQGVFMARQPLFMPLSPSSCSLSDGEHDANG